MLARIMESILGIVQSPVFLGLTVLLGLVALLRLILGRDPTLKRVYGHDRRKSREPMSSVPFYDSEGVLVADDRRKQGDRRLSQFSGLQYRASASDSAQS